MSVMASHWRLHYLLNHLFRHKSKKTQSSASLALVRGLQRWFLDSPYRGPITQKIFPFDDIIMFCVFKLGTETFLGYVRHPREQYHLSHDRELMFVTSVTNIPKCLMLFTLGTHLVVFMSVIVRVSPWYQSHNIRREIRWKAKAILPPNIKLIPDSTKTKSVVEVFPNYIIFLNINVVFDQVCFGR